MAAKVDPQRQIRQMVNFIMQEAHEKVNEIKIKTEHDFTLERQNLVHHGKIKIQEEYAQKEKDLEIQQRVSRSNAIGESRVKKMKARDDLLQKLKKEALERLEGFTTTPQYSNMIKKLIIQGQHSYYIFDLSTSSSTLEHCQTTDVSRTYQNGGSYRGGTIP